MLSPKVYCVVDSFCFSLPVFISGHQPNLLLVESLNPGDGNPSFFPNRILRRANASFAPSPQNSWENEPDASSGRMQSNCSSCLSPALPFLPSIIYHPLPHRKMHLGVHSTPSSSGISGGSTTETPDLLTEKPQASLKFRHG